MKFYLRIISLCLLSLVISTPAFSGIKFGSGGHRHNFAVGSNSGLLKSTNEKSVCIFCHTPHGGSGGTPLWNRQAPSTVSFPIYGNRANIQIDDIAAAQYNAAFSTYPNGSTRFCLSCHDGVSSVGAVLNVGGSLPITMEYDNLNDFAAALISDNPSGGVVDLSVSHPVSFIYDGTVVSALDAFYGAGTYNWPISDSDVNVDAQSMMQCTTCHDPHTDTRQGVYTMPFWAKYTGGDGSADFTATCNVCHSTPPGGTMHGM